MLFFRPAPDLLRAGKSFEQVAFFPPRRFGALYQAQTATIRFSKKLHARREVGLVVGHGAVMHVGLVSDLTQRISTVRVTLQLQLVDCVEYLAVGVGEVY